MTKCPKCGEELKVVNADAIVDAGMQYCVNEKCKGWYCFYCNKWHKYGTYCGEADMNFSIVYNQRRYDEWCKKHKEDIFRMLKDSKYYYGCHDVDKYYPKDALEILKELEELDDE